LGRATKFLRRIGGTTTSCRVDGQALAADGGQNGSGGIASRAGRSVRSHLATLAVAAPDRKRSGRPRRASQAAELDWHAHAQATGLSRATVNRILTRLKLNQWKMLEPALPIVRYVHPSPGDLLHLDIKKLGRIVKAGPSHHPWTRLVAPAARYSTSLATITPGWPSPPCIRMKRPPPAPTPRRPPLSSAVSATPSAACSPTTAPGTSDVSL
jgi:hypothetical protein